MLKEISVVAIALSAISVSGLQAQEPNSGTSNQVVNAVQHVASVTKSDAKKIMKKYLKSTRPDKRLRVGKIKKIDDAWEIIITSIRKYPVSTAYVNDKTGEITF